MVRNGRRVLLLLLLYSHSFLIMEKAGGVYMIFLHLLYLLAFCYTSHSYTRMQPPGPGQQQHQQLIARAGWFDIACLTVLCSSTMGAMSWQDSLEHGFATGLVSLAFSSLAYLCIIYCLAELTSAIPFSGGSEYI